MQASKFVVAAGADRQLWLPGSTPPKHLDGRYRLFIPQHNIFRIWRSEVALDWRGARMCILA